MTKTISGTRALVLLLLIAGSLQAASHGPCVDMITSEEALVMHLKKFMVTVGEVTIPYEDEVAELKEKAESFGSGEAYCLLGKIYSDIRPTKDGRKRYARAIECFGRAAEKGEEKAASALGMLFLSCEQTKEGIASGIRHIAQAHESLGAYSYWRMARLTLKVRKDEQLSDLMVLLKKVQNEVRNPSEAELDEALISVTEEVRRFSPDDSE